MALRKLSFLFLALFLCSFEFFPHTFLWTVKDVVPEVSPDEEMWTALVFSSTCVVNRKDLNNQLVVDHEGYYAAFGKRWGLGNETYLHISLMGGSTSRGFLDGFLRSYHKTLGLPYSGNLRPSNEFRVLWIEKGKTLYETDADAIFHNPTVVLTKRFRTTAFSLGVELPLGTGGPGRNRLSTFSSVSLALPRLKLSLTAKNRFGSTVEELSYRKFRIYWRAETSGKISKMGSWFATVEGGSSSYPNSTFKELRRPPVFLAFGYKEKGWTVGFTEDLNNSTACDFQTFFFKSW